MRTWRWSGRLAGFWMASACLHSGHADIANSLEPDYAEAVIAYHAHDYARALKILNELQKKAPKSVEFLELKAITLKANQQTPAAGKVYRELVQLKTNLGSPKKEIAPYAFELGIIRFNEKQYAQADQYLSYAVRSEFNVEVALLYLGLIGVQVEDWDRAEKYLLLVTEGKLEDLKPAAHFYLGQVYFRKQVPANGFGELVTAKRIAARNLESNDASDDSRAMAAQIVKGVDTALAPFDCGQRFANFSFIVGYDSNVLLVPNETDARASATTESSLKATVSAAAGYSTSPLNRYQLVPNLRINANRNLNDATTAGEFSETGLSLFITRDALSPRAYGLRLDASVIFQNERDPATDHTKYRLYTSGFTFAPYVKADLNRKWVLNAELGVRQVSFNGDGDLTSDLRRNGPVTTLRAGVQSKTARKFINPGLGIKVEQASTSGTEFRAFAFGAGFTNTFVYRQIQFTQAIDLTRTHYGKSSTDRRDTLVSGLVSAFRKIGPRWAVLGSIDYTKNRSSDAETFAYHRYSVNSGLSYSF